jgi:dipeptidase E
MQIILTSTNNTVCQHWSKKLGIYNSGKKVLFIYTAAEVYDKEADWLLADKQALVDCGFVVTDFTVTDKTYEQVEAAILQTDIICVSGGNTFYLLQQMNICNFNHALKKHIQEDLVYVGISAGSVVAAPDIDYIKDLDDAKEAPNLIDTKGLRLCDISVLPHWGSEGFKEDYKKCIAYNYKLGSKIILLTDEQYVYLNNGSYTIESI